MLGYRLSGQWMASPDPIRFTIKRFNENMTQNYNNGVVIITDPGYYAVTAFFHVWADSYTAIMKNYNIIEKIQGVNKLSFIPFSVTSSEYTK